MSDDLEMGMYEVPQPTLLDQEPKTIADLWIEWVELWGVTSGPVKSLILRALREGNEQALNRVEISRQEQAPRDLQAWLYVVLKDELK